MELSPSIYEHAAAVIGRTPWEVSRDEGLLFESHAAALLHLIEGQVSFAEEIKRRGLDVAFFESAACPPLLSPAMFHSVELPALSAAMARMGAVLGRPIPCIIGGNTAPILDAILETGTGYVAAPHETDQTAFMEKIRDRTDVRVRINMDVEVISRGSWERIRAEADRVVRLAEGRENVCLGTGALPYETVPENVLRLREYVEAI